MNVKVWYEIRIPDYWSGGYELKVHYKYNVSKFKTRKGSYIVLKKNEGLQHGRLYESIEDFFKRIVDQMKNKQKTTQETVTNKILTEVEGLEVKDLAFKLARKGFKFKI